MDEEVLTAFLIEAGFCLIERVGSFETNFHDGNGVYYDSSLYIFKDYFISLNLIAKICEKNDTIHDGFALYHTALPFIGNRGYKINPNI